MYATEAGLRRGEDSSRFRSPARMLVHSDETCRMYIVPIKWAQREELNVYFFAKANAPASTKPHVDYRTIQCDNKLRSPVKRGGEFLIIRTTTLLLHVGNYFYISILIPDFEKNINQKINY